MSSTRSIRNGKGHRAYRRKQAALKRRTKLENLPCEWCGNPIDTELHYNDRWAFTADHPLSLGHGGHLVKQKLAPFHRRCNALKNDQVETEIWSAS
jgi:hypothetical protein